MQIQEKPKNLPLGILQKLQLRNTDQHRDRAAAKNHFEYFEYCSSSLLKVSCFVIALRRVGDIGLSYCPERVVRSTKPVERVPVVRLRDVPPAIRYTVLVL